MKQRVGVSPGEAAWRGAPIGRQGWFTAADTRYSEITSWAGLADGPALIG